MTDQHGAARDDRRSEPRGSERPVVRVVGDDGNVFLIMAAAIKALKRAGLEAVANDLRRRVWDSGSYHEALAIMGEYVDLA